MIQEAIEYVNCLFEETKKQHNSVNDVILKSALVYQYLHLKNFASSKSINDILEINDKEIGLIGPGNGCLTHLLERIFKRFNKLHSHSILHDAFGRFYTHHSLDRGYTYIIPENLTPNWIKKISIMWSDFWINILHIQKNHNINYIYERTAKKYIHVEWYYS